MKKIFSKLLLICCALFPAASYATSITSLRTSPILISGDDETVEITGNGSLEVDTDLLNPVIGEAPISNSFYSGVGSFLNTSITVNTTLSSDGIIATGQNTGAILFSDFGSSLNILNLTSGTISSEITSGVNGTINLRYMEESTPIINIGQASGNSGTLSNSGIGGNALRVSGSNTTNLTINVNQTGTISSQGNAIFLFDALGTSALTLNNSGTISAASGYKALKLDNYSALINNDGTINGDITTIIGGPLYLNNSGTINGDIDLGSAENSFVQLNDGLITGDILMNNSTHEIIFNGGLLTGNINGTGNVTINSSIVLNGSIGNDSMVSLLKISDGKNFSLYNSSKVLQSDKISIGYDASLTINYAQLTTNEIEGLSTNNGALILNLEDNSNYTINTVYGTADKGLQSITINGNLSDATKASDTIINASFKALTTTFAGLDSRFTLSSAKSITGNVVIGDSTVLRLEDASSISGTIKGSAQFKGNLTIRNQYTDTDPAAVSSVTLNSDIGGDNKNLSTLTLDYNTYVDAATNNIAIKARDIYLSSFSNLVLGTGSVTGTIHGHVDSGSSNGFGKVTFNDDNTLAGNVGTSNGAALNTVEIAVGKNVSAGTYEINASNIELGAGAVLTSAGLISGGDNDDSGASFKNTTLTLSSTATLTLNDGAQFYGNIESSASDNAVFINTTLDATNSRLNIGVDSEIGILTISNSATVDVKANNGVITAYQTYLDNNTTLKLGDGEIAGKIDGYFNDDYGTLDIRGNVTLNGNIGDLNSIHLLNIGAVDDGGYTLTANRSIKATNITINGSSSQLVLDATKTITGNVTISGGATLSVGDISVVNGEIKGDYQYYGRLLVRDFSDFYASGDIGAGGFDLGEITIYGALDLSDGDDYEAHSQIFSLHSEAHLVIGSKTVEGMVLGVAEDGGASNGVGKGNVSFVANTDATKILVSKFGDNEGHALSQISVGENLIVDIGDADISAERIMLYNGASLTSSAGEITGGNQIYGGFTRLNTQIVLNDGASLTLNNIGTFLGTIDGNDDSQGDLTLTGSYVYDDGDDAIDIGATKKLNSIALTDSTTLDVSRYNGYVKADTITLGSNAVLTLGNADIIGQLYGNADEHGTLNILGTVNSATTIGGAHNLSQLNIGDSSHFAALNASDSIYAVNINLRSTGVSGEYSALTMADDAEINGDVSLGLNTRIYLNNGADIRGKVQGENQYEGEIIVQENAAVTAFADIGGDGLDLMAVGIKNGALLDLNTHNVALNAASISMIDSATLNIGSGTVTGEILGYDSSANYTDNYGVGKGDINFTNDNTVGGNIGNNSGNAVNGITVSSLKTVDFGSHSLYTAMAVLQESATLKSSGIIGGGINSEGTRQNSSVFILNIGSTVELSSGASVNAGIIGSGDDSGSLIIKSGLNLASNIAVGSSGYKLAEVNIENLATLNLATYGKNLRAHFVEIADGGTLILGSGTVDAIIGGIESYKGTLKIAGNDNSFVNLGSTAYLGDIGVELNEVNIGYNLAGGTANSLNVSIANSIEAATVKVVGNNNLLSIAAGATINGDVVLDGDNILSLGNGSTVNGTIRNTSTETANASLIIRDNATVTTNGDIGGGGYNFNNVQLKDGSHLDLSANNNSIDATLVQISYDAKLTIGSATVSSDIQAYNSEGGSNYGLGEVVFADNNTIGSYVGSESGATLAKVTINNGKTVDANSHSISALEIIVGNEATLRNSASINAGASTEGGDIQNSSIRLGENATLELSEIVGETIKATISGNDSDGQGKLQIASGTITAYADIGYYYSLAEVNLATATTLDLDLNGVSLKSSVTKLNEDATLIIGTQSVTGNIYATNNNNDSKVYFYGATNSLAGNLGGSNNNAITNVTINAANRLNTGSHQINAATIILDNYATLNTSGAISGGADITGTTPIATAIYIDSSANLILNSGAAIYGTIDGADTNIVGGINIGVGNLEIMSDYTTHGDIGSNFKLNSVILHDGVNLNLATNSNSLNAQDLYIGDGAIVVIGGGSVNATISSLSSYTGLLYINDSSNINSGATLGGDSGLLALYIDNAGAGNVIVDSSDSIKASSVIINGNNSKLNLATNKNITGNVSLGDGAILSLANNSTVFGAIDSVSDSDGKLTISGSVTSNGDIGNSYLLNRVTLQSGATLNLATNDNILKADNITLNSGSHIIIGSGTVNGTFLGANDGEGTISFYENATISSRMKIGDVMSLGASTSIGEVVINSGVTVTQNENIAATITTINSGGTLNIGSTKGIDGDHITLGGTLIVNNNSYLNAALQGDSGTGDLIINSGAALTTSNYLGGDDSYHLNSITLNNSATLDLATNNNSANATNIILSNNANIIIGSGAVAGNIKGTSNGRGNVTFDNDNDLGGDIGANNYAVRNITINGSITGNTIDTQGNAIYASNNIALQNKAQLITSAAISNGTDGATSITMYDDSTLTLQDGASIIAAINAAGNADDSGGIGTIEVSGGVDLNGNIGNLFKVRTIAIADGATLTNNANAGIINAATITVGTGAALTMYNISGSGSGDFGLNGNVNGAGTVNLTAAGGTYDLNAVLGTTSTFAEVNITTSSNTLNIKNSVQAGIVNLNNSGGSSFFTLAANKNISGDVVMSSNTTLNLKNNSSVSGAIEAAEDNNGILVIGSNLFGSGGADAVVVANAAIGASDKRLSSITINDNATLDLATHAVDAYSHNASIGINSELTIGNAEFNVAGQLLINQYSAITIGSGTLRADTIEMQENSAITVNDGAIYGEVYGNGAVTFNETNTLNNKMGSTSEGNLQLQNLTIASDKTLTADYEIAASAINIASGGALNSSAKISGGLYGSSLNSAEVSLGDGATLALNNNSSITANINSSSADAFGNIEISGAIAGNINFGNDAKLASMLVNSDSSLNLSANNNSLNIENIALASNSNLTIGTTTFASAIDGSRDNYGSLNIATNKTATSYGDIGNLHYLNEVNIGANATLNLAIHNNALKAATINLSSAATLNIGSGAISGSFVGASSGNGNINFKTDKTIASGAALLGSSEKNLGTITIENGANLELSNSIYANNINIGNSGASATSLTISVSGSKVISGDITIANRGNLTVNLGGILTTQAIGSAADGVGTVNLSGNGSLILHGDIGSAESSLSALSVGNNSFVNATGGQSIFADDIYLNSGSGIAISSGTLAANIHGGGSGGSIYFNSSDAQTLQGNLGSIYDDVAIGHVEIAGLLNTASYSVNVNNFTFNSTDAVLTIGSGRIDIANFTNENPESGIINVNASNNIDFAIDAENKIAELNIANGATVTANQSINASNITIGSGTSGRLILSENKILTGDVLMNNGANLTFNNNSSIDGNITNPSGSSAYFAGNLHATGNININGTAIFSAAATTITTNSFNVNSGSSLSLAINLSSPASSALEIIGSAILSANTNLNLTISGSAASGTTITLLNASASSAINAIAGSKININNSGRNILHGQTYTTSVSGNQLLLTLSGDAVADSLNFSNSNYQKIYDVILNATNAQGEILTAQNYLNNNSYSIEEKEAAIKSLTPAVDNSSNRIAFNNGSTTAEIFSARIESLNNNSITTAGPSFNFNINSNGKSANIHTLEPLRDNNIKPSYPLALTLENNKAMWIQTFGSNIKQNNNAKTEGYDSNSGGVLIGFDYKKQKNLIIGTGIGFSNSNTKNNDSTKRTAIESYQVSAYSGYNAKSYFLNNSITLAFNNYNSNRAIKIINSSATANYNGQTYTLRSEIGKNFNFKNNLIFTPTLMLTASYNKVENYDEKGAGTLNLQVKNDSAKFFETRIGIEVSKLYLTAKNTKIRPQFSISYGYDLIGDQQKTTSNFVGQSTSFSNEGAKVAQGSLKIGTGFAFYTTEDITLSTNYSFEHRNSYNSNSLWLRVRYGF